MQIDILIVGQGLAGSLLAWTLLEHGFSIMIVDTGEQNASQVAAGLINPVTGQRLVKSKEVDYLLPAAMAYFQRVSEAFKQVFFVSMPMLRILKNDREHVVASQRLTESEYQGFLSFFAETSACANAKFGMLEQQQTGYLKTRLLLKTLRDFYRAKGVYRRVRLDYNDVVLQPRLKWLDIEPSHIVFCEGHEAVKNPWFGNLPFQPAKGEILSCQTSAQLPTYILNFGHWLIPTGEQTFRVGATFEPGCRDTLPSEKSQTALLNSALKIMPALAPIEVQDHQAGVRPTTLDKQPFIGSHPRYSKLHIFNGFGAKGSLQIPWHSIQFAQSLRQQGVIFNKAQVSRYYETHFPS